jgi:diguanylate cyclase (GGDEF)-like protein
MPAEDPDWGSFLQAAALAMLEAADEGLIVFDGAGRCRMIGRRAGEIFGVEPAMLVGLPREEVLGALSRQCEEADVFLRATAADAPLGVPKTVTDIDIVRPRPRTVVCKGVPISRPDMSPGRLIVVRDVTRERAGERSSVQLRARLSALTPFDPLTGLLNARRFREELEREHGRSSRAWDSYAVLRLDVDGMRAINEEFGIPVGDRVLEQVASRLKACLREYDVLARLADDEFAVLLPGADVIAARAVAERMLQAIGGSLELLRERGVTLSAGGALWIPPSGQVANDILERAGEVLTGARSRGPNELELDAPLVPAQ